MDLVRYHGYYNPTVMEGDTIFLTYLLGGLPSSGSTTAGPIGDTFPPGSDYRIRAYTAAGDEGFSGYFSINTGSSGSGSITITSPSPGTVWLTGNQYIISGST